jgi:hypothetical protein
VRHGSLLQLTERGVRPAWGSVHRPAVEQGEEAYRHASVAVQSPGREI